MLAEFRRALAAERRYVALRQADAVRALESAPRADATQRVFDEFYAGADQPAGAAPGRLAVTARPAAPLRASRPVKAGS
jgi:hypothetical protein